MREKSVEKVQKLREEIEAVKNEIKMAQQKYDLEKAAELLVWQAAAATETVGD